MSHSKSITHWHYSSQTEAQRLVFTAYQVSRYFYQLNNFTVLPNPPKNLNQTHVIFPDVSYPKSFWQEANKINYSLPIRVSPHLESNLTPLITKLKSYSDVLNLNKPFKPRSHPLYQPWHSIESQVLEFFNGILPDLHNRLTRITIFPTQFGIQASFNRLYPHQTELELYLRYDADLGKIVEIIFDALERQSLMEEYQASWSEAEIVSDWLLSNTRLRDIINTTHTKTPPQKLIHHLRSHNPSPDIISQSRSFLNKLGYYLDSSPLSLENNQIKFQNQPINHFTTREHLALTQLIQHKSISTDQLADIIFSNDDEYSLYALAKFIQRLRDKLESYGLSGSCIQTVRGYGYTLR